MIKLDFLLAISIYLSALLMFIIGKWVFESRDVVIKKISQDTKFILQCSVCNFIYHDYSSNKISICPRCKSYLEEKEAKI